MVSRVRELVYSTIDYLDGTKKMSFALFELEETSRQVIES
jgi:hypothetical protein